MKDRTKNAYNTWASDYDTDRNTQTALEFEDVIRLNNVRKNERVLDAACGTGRYTEVFAKKKARVVGVDFSQQMLKIAQKKNSKIDYQYADLNKRLPFPNSSFDKINCAQALKHLARLDFIAREFMRVLKRGGQLIFSVTHPEMDWTGYRIKYRPRFVLAHKADIYHHKFADYFEAFAKVGFVLSDFVQLPVTSKIKRLLTRTSYQRVRGRHQIAIFKFNKRR